MKATASVRSTLNANNFSTYSCNVSRENSSVNSLACQRSISSRLGLRGWAERRAARSTLLSSTARQAGGLLAM